VAWSYGTSENTEPDNTKRKALVTKFIAV